MFTCILLLLPMRGHAGVVVSGLDPHDTDWVSGTVTEIGVSAKMERDKEKSGGKTLS